MTAIYLRTHAVYLNFSFPYNLKPFGATTELVPNWFNPTTFAANLQFSLFNGNGIRAGNPQTPFTYIEAVPLSTLSAFTGAKVFPTQKVPSYILQIYIDPDVLNYNMPYEGVWTGVLHWDVATFGVAPYPIPQSITFQWGGVPQWTYDNTVTADGILTTMGPQITTINTQVTTTAPGFLRGDAQNASAYSSVAASNTAQLAAGQPLSTAITATNAAVTTDVASPKNLFHYVKTALASSVPIPAILPSGPPPAPLVAPNMADQMALTYWMLSGLRRTFDTATGRVYLDLSPLGIVPTPTVYFQCWADAARTVPATTLAEVIVQDPWTIIP